MTQEEKELLLRDLCARLPYGVNCYCGYNAQLKLVCPDGDYCVIQNSPYAIETVKPYLRPLSSMTDEEKNEYLNTFKKSIIGTDKEDGRVWTVDSIDYLNAHHFDYRGLIEKGLAIEAPEGMYKLDGINPIVK